MDLQGFKKPCKEFVLKELAAVPLVESAEPTVHLFKPPFPWKKLTTKYKRKNLWLELCYHGLAWNSGDHEYTEIEKILRQTLQNATQVFVIGQVKKEWLEKFDFKVVDISELGIPNFDQRLTKTDSSSHHNCMYKNTCAVNNVKSIQKLYFSDFSDWVMDWEDTRVNKDIELVL
ncbi:hypothetical protein [Escherichia coli]|uniref:hypothetical protein n=1 Tax=Escherichia coli TaxID=562 RepID=UPI0029163886|nr:hypothetical protein [Escherichia coli]